MSGPSTAVLPEALVRALGRARTAGVVTGAGVSVDSGIPTYRGKGGIYDDPLKGDAVVEALSGPTFRTDPDRTWRVIAWKAGLARGAKPNAAHLAIAEMERRAERFVLLTQNVDGLHRAAGSRNVIEIHGNALRTRCPSCGERKPLDAETLSTIERAPRCPCGARLRPDVVLFEEALPTEELARLETELLLTSPDLVLVAGTTAVFPYVVAPVALAAERGRLTVEVNPEETALSRVVAHSLRGRASDLLPAIAAAFARA